MVYSAKHRPSTRGFRDGSDCPESEGIPCEAASFHRTSLSRRGVPAWYLGIPWYTDYWRVVYPLPIEHSYGKTPFSKVQDIYKLAKLIFSMHGCNINYWRVVYHHCGIISTRPKKHISCISQTNHDMCVVRKTRALSRYLRLFGASHVPSWLVVSNIFSHNIWDNPSHWLSYFSEGWLNHQTDSTRTTGQLWRLQVKLANYPDDSPIAYKLNTLWLFNSLPWYRWPICRWCSQLETSIYKRFSMAMLNNQMVYPIVY